MKNSSKKPFVSVCTPTFNRRPFIPYMTKCFDNQTYPKELMEWIIIDDGTDKIGDLVKDHPNVKYFAYDEKMPLGKKRNLMHEKSKGEIIVYMDDDDYYPSMRVSHAVETLQANPNALCAGSSRIYIYYDHVDKIYEFGPYGDNHATAGTFAFKRKLLENSMYDDEACLAEERAFLKNYTVPFVQLDPEKVILVFAHDHNTVNKKKILENINPQFTRVLNKTVEELIPEKELCDFYKTHLNKTLATYDAGKPLFKPDVMENILKIEEERRIFAEKRANENGQIVLKNQDGSIRHISSQEMISIVQHQQVEMQNMQQKFNHLRIAIEQKDSEIDNLTHKLHETINNNLKLQELNLKMNEKLMYFVNLHNKK